MKIDISRVSLTEADIEQYLFENPEAIHAQLNNGSKIYVEKWIGRQFIVPSGIIDLLGELNSGAIAVVEVKLGAIDGKAIAQVCRYAADIDIAVGMVIVGMSNVPVLKFVVGDSIDTKSMFECGALDVAPLVFSAKLSLSVNQMYWNEDFRQSLPAKHEAISSNNEIVRLQSQWNEMYRQFQEANNLDEPYTSEEAREGNTEAQEVES